MAHSTARHKAHLQQACDGSQQDAKEQDSQYLDQQHDSPLCVCDGRDVSEPNGRDGSERPVRCCQVDHWPWNGVNLHREIALLLLESIQVTAHCFLSGTQCATWMKWLCCLRVCSICEV